MAVVYGFCLYDADVGKWRIEEQGREYFVSECKHCGNDPEFIVGKDSYYIQCHTCKMRTPNSKYVQKAVNIWNGEFV